MSTAGLVLKAYKTFLSHLLTVTFSNGSHDCRDGLRRVQISRRKFLGTVTFIPLPKKDKLSKKGAMNTLQLKSVTINASTYLLNALSTGRDNNVS